MLLQSATRASSRRRPTTTRSRCSTQGRVARVFADMLRRLKLPGRVWRARAGWAAISRATRRRGTDTPRGKVGARA
jgi:hypothetical protein